MKIEQLEEIFDDIYSSIFRINNEVDSLRRKLDYYDLDDLGQDIKKEKEF
jgi:hypothetical protein